MQRWFRFKIMSVSLIWGPAFVTTKKHVDDVVVIQLSFVYNLEYNLFSIQAEIIVIQFVNRSYMILICFVPLYFPIQV